MLRKIEEPPLLDVLDRLLDKGIVIDAWIHFSLAGIDFLTVEAYLVVASIETYLHYGHALSAPLSHNLRPVDYWNWSPGKPLRK